VKTSALLEPEVWLEEGAQLHPAAVEPALEGRLPDADDLSGCLCGQAFEVA
jgi:hypothetical protein